MFHFIILQYILSVHHVASQMYMWKANIHNGDGVRLRERAKAFDLPRGQDNWIKMGIKWIFPQNFPLLTQRGIFLVISIDF